MITQENYRKHLFSYKKYFTEGILILLLTVLVYSLVYAYNYGYDLYFNIPTEFESFSIVSIFNTGSVVLFSILLSVFGYLGSVDIRDLRLVGRHAALIRNWLVVSLFLLISTVTSVSGGLPIVSIVTFGIFLYVTIRYGLSPLVRYRKLNNYDEKVNKYIESRLRDNKTFGHYIWNFALYRTSTYLIVPIMLIAYIVSYGYSSASNTDEFYVSSSLNNYAVIRFIDNKAVLVEYAKDNRLTKSIRIIEVTGNQVLTKKTIGKLKN